MNLTQFAAELFDKIKAWIDPKLAAIKADHIEIKNAFETLDANYRELLEANQYKFFNIDSRFEKLDQSNQKYIDQALAKLELPRGEKGEKGDPGDPGRDGVDGKDALEQINFLPAIDFDKSYPRDTYGYHNGSLYRSYKQTEGDRGWDLFLAGLNSITLEQTDERTLKVCIGENVCELKFPVMIYRGVWNPDTEYNPGDVVTLRGSTWHNDLDHNSARPNGPDSGWKMVVRAGRDAPKCP